MHQKYLLPETNNLLAQAENTQYSLNYHGDA